MPDDQASAVAVVSPALAALPQVAVAVEHGVAVAADLHVVAVGCALAQVHDAFVVVAAAAGQLRVAAVVVIAVALVLRRVRPVAVVVERVELRVQLAPHHDRLAVARSADAVALARRDVVHAAVELVALEEQLAVTTFAPFAVHRVRGVRLSFGTSVPSHAPVQYSPGGPSPSLDGSAVPPALCS